MALASLSDLAAALDTTHVSSMSGVSFAGKSMKLDTEADAASIVQAIEKCSNLHYLNLEGNTLGVAAANAIAKALEKHPEFKQALWKDMFTGRLIAEIPAALESLGVGLMAAAAQLNELDLSDNAFGPNGVRGLVNLLSGSACYSLEILRLNNNGLGITGGKALAKALHACYENSDRDTGKPLALKVFIAGRNRLENEGAKALAGVFQTLGTLEEIAMPQNGIRHPGIGYLSEAFIQNPNLRVINLNDNLIGAKAAPGLAKAMKSLKDLRSIDFGDCLLKTSGAVRLASGLSSCPKLEQVLLSHNSIRVEGATVIITALKNNTALKTLLLDGNTFGSEGKKEIKAFLKNTVHHETLGSLSEDESPDEDDDSSVENSHESGTESEEDDDEENAIIITEEIVTEMDPNIVDISRFMEQSKLSGEDDAGLNEVAEEYDPLRNDVSVEEVRCEGEYDEGKIVSAEEFMKSPNADNLLWLGKDRVIVLINKATEIAKKNSTSFVEVLLPIIMKVGALSVCNRSNVSDIAKTTSTELYKLLFNRDVNVSDINSALLIHLGLMKSEDKLKPTWNLEGCFLALEQIADSNFLPEATKDTLVIFLAREVEKDNLIDIKSRIIPKLK